MVCRDPQALPTPEEITRLCQDIRRSWSPKERAKRRGEVRGWQPPVVALSQILAEAGSLNRRNLAG